MVEDTITMSKTNMGILIIGLIVGSIVGTYIIDSYLLTLGFGPSGLTISDEENIDLPARTDTEIEWRIQGRLESFGEAGVRISDTDGDNEKELKEDKDFEVNEYEDYISINLKLNKDYDDDDFLLTAYAIDINEREVSDEIVVDIYDPFFANIDGEFEEDEWQTINHHVQYIMPYNLTAIIEALFGEGSDDDIFDIEDVAITDYAFLETHYTKDDGLYILYDWCFDLLDDTQYEGFGLFIDTDGDRRTMLNISDNEFEDELNDGLEMLMYQSDTGSANTTFLGLIELNSTLTYTIARGFGKTVNSQNDHVFFEIHVESNELKYGFGNYMSEYSYNVGGIGAMNMPGIAPVMFFMTPCISIPLAEATFFMCGTDAYDVNFRP